MIYGCQRTATVISKKYSTLAMLSKANFKEISTEYPEISKYLKEGIYKYRDRMKKFLIDTLKRVEYFSNLDEEVLHDLLYSI